MKKLSYATPSWYAALRTASHDMLARCRWPTLGSVDPDILLEQGRMLVIAVAALLAALHYQ